MVTCLRGAELHPYTKSFDGHDLSKLITGSVPVPDLHAHALLFSFLSLLMKTGKVQNLNRNLQSHAVLKERLEREKNECTKSGNCEM